MVDPAAVWWKIEKLYQTYALKLADETNLSFSFDPPTYYIIIAFLSYIVPIACR